MISLESGARLRQRIDQREDGEAAFSFGDFQGFVGDRFADSVLGELQRSFVGIVTVRGG